MENLDLESKSDVIAATKEAGFTVSEAQWKRWHLHGLLPEKALMKHLGRGKGTESWYPPGTGRQLVALCKWQKYDRRLGVVGWCLWSEGFPVRCSMRETLIGILDRIEESLRSQVDAFEADEPNAIAAAAKNTGKALKLAWLGRRIGADLLETLFHLACRALLGDIEKAEPSDEVWEMVAGATGAAQRQFLGREVGTLDGTGETTSAQGEQLFRRSLGAVSIPNARAWLMEITDADLDLVRLSARGLYLAWDPERAQAEPLPPRLFMVALLFKLTGHDLEQLFDRLFPDPDGAILGRLLRDALLNNSIKRSTRFRRKS